ncbi:restriction endonuclease subunit S [Bacteroides faecis]|uniref:restriction endonuclease subunit S n=1 Tax=Bacteroides faecis TaxID=674529 RepID=UPI0021648807|nr:restriction endonuclease subunit S [Bacteroides faecis]UVS36889.1 restriction endonuclease subunit S [Bacteroides faecis]
MSDVPHLRFPEFSGEWEETTLGKISEITKGSGISKDQLSEQGSPCILYGELYTKYNSEVIGVVYSRTELESSSLVKSKANDVIIPCSGETAIDISTARCVPFNNILLGGDLNIIRLKHDDGGFFAYQLNGARKKDIARVAQGVSVVHLYGENLKHIRVYHPVIEEQKKITRLLSLIDERIATQNKVIEDLKLLKSAIIERAYRNRSYHPCRIGDVIEQISERNKDKSIDMVLSVSNKQGFINQSEQFEDRIIASEDTSNYKIVHKNDFAYNPARINVGSIARLTTIDTGIVSPMYICFRVKNGVATEYMEHFFSTSYFFYEMQKRLEGSVRQCLSFESICNIPIYIPSSEEQHTIGKKISVLLDKIDIETHYHCKLVEQKHYLLRQMFI